MTFSTGSSAASASASKSAPQAVAAEHGIFVGMDEAGYGPNLGPLVIAATRWKTPQHPERCEFYQLLKRSVAADGTSNGTRLHLADSKAVNVGKYGFRSLESSALALLACLDIRPESLVELQAQVCHQLPDDHPMPAPWHLEPVALPVESDGKKVAALADKLRRCMSKSSAELLSVRVDVIVEARFNQLVNTHGNKGLALSRLAFQLLRSIWHPAEEQPAIVIGDKHGGRNRYDELLSEVLDGEMIFRLEEGQQLSRYRVGSSELRFQVGGEAHLPVACASIIAKYLRELAMVQFNQFWKKHCPEVKPTLGYPLDARRFRDAVDLKRSELQISDEIFWRSR